MRAQGPRGRGWQGLGKACSSVRAGEEPGLSTIWTGGLESCSVLGPRP